MMRRTFWRIFLAFLALVVLALAFSRTLTDWMWFASLGFGQLWTTPWLWRVGTFVAAFATSLAILWVNLAISRAALSQGVVTGGQASPRSSGPWTWLRRFAGAAMVGVAAAIALGASGGWLDVALFAHGEPFGIEEPLLGQDAAFYVFTLPVARLALWTVGVSVLVALTFSGLVYSAAGILRWRRAGGAALMGGPRRHLLIMLAVVALLWAAQSYLSRFDLLFSQAGIIFGPTYTDAHVRLPVRTAVSALALVTAAATAASAWGARTRWALGAFGLAVIVAAGGELVAAGVYRLVVRPNELVREEPYLSQHIDLTRRAFGLQGVREVDYDPKGGLDGQDVAAASALLQEIRVWDWRPLGSVYSQLQEFRPYYGFVEVDVDRYRVGGRTRQVMLSARELDAVRLHNPTWINVRLQYTHGYGLVMSPAAEVTSQGMPDLVVSDIPPRSEPGWPQVTRPQIYFGELPASWVVVGARTAEFDHPAGDQNVSSTYRGRDGIRLAPWNRLLFAARFASAEMVFSPEITSGSRILMIRNVTQRLRTLMPHLRYDRDPYLVVDGDGHLVWIVDAYTTTDRFPNARPVPGWGNYARNAVKATVDAYDGTVHFYLIDEQDPVAAALSAAFGGFMEPASAMPASLRDHWRYPEDLFTLQAGVLGTYHMVDPGLFYNQEDQWDSPREIYGDTESVMQPYYAMVDLGDGPEFAMLMPFVAQGKQNMVAWMVARSDGPRYGEIMVYRFPKQRLTYGPMQIEARINQDPEISREITLWGQRGSQVLRGNLIVVPVRGTVLYVKPLFLVSEQSRMPELRRVVVATASQLAMAPTLDEALARIVAQAAAVQPPQVPGQAPVAPTLPEASADERARQALDALEAARSRLGQGDWEGFGRAMDDLRRLLEDLAGENRPPQPAAERAP